MTIPLKTTPGPWSLDQRHIRSPRGDTIAHVVHEGADATLLASAPALHTQLKRIQGWLFVELLHVDRPLCRESAAKALQEINELLNPLEAL